MGAYLGYLALVGAQLPLFYRRDNLTRYCFDTGSYLLVCCIELVILTGIRGYTVGADTKYYLSALSYYGRMPLTQLISADLIWPYDYEIGYFTLVKICAALGIGNTGFLFIVSLLIYIPIFVVIKRHSPMPFVSIVCFFAFGLFSYSLGIFRQMIASSILLCGWNFIEERKFAKYLLIVILAMTFHTTSIAGIFLYILYGVNWKKIVWWTFPAEIILLFFGRYFAILLMKIFPKYYGYLGSQYDAQGGTYLMLLLLNIVLIASMLIKEKIEETDENNYGMVICALILAIAIQCVGYNMLAIGRAKSYFTFYLIFAIPIIVHNLIKELEFRWMTVISGFVMLFLIALTIMEFSGNKFVVPYYTFLADAF